MDLDPPPPGTAAFLPVEIWTHIHFLATCSDDGSTGRTLSCVSKDWRSISAPFKLQSVALVGPRPILRFLALLESTPANLRIVRSLFIGAQNPQPRVGRPAQVPQIDVVEERLRGLTFTDKLFPDLGLRYTSSLSADMHTVQWVGIPADAVERAVTDILHRVAPTLYTLHTHFHQRARLLYDVHLPQLRVLVLHGQWNTPAGPATLPFNSDPMPSLRTLKIAGTPTPGPGQATKVTALLGTVASAAPGLTHLYFPQTAVSTNVSLKRDLERALERGTLRGIERVVVEIADVPIRSRTPPPGANGGAQAADRERTEREGLLTLAREDWRVRVVPAPKWWVDVQTALIEWEEGHDDRWGD
ncbi:hypothetical protein MKEN_00771100 [Mycena kentingensis (nom. inval.)]|nr:hypothetical protein MKEN_00771100 [Mycena kentingensis (nom. inval.)]